MKIPVTLISDGLKIAGQFFIPENGVPPFPAVCLCHGVPTGTINPMDGGYPALAEKLSEEGFASFCFNFRGCGSSEGNFDILGWTRDAETAIDYIWNSIDVEITKIFMVGFSAGAAVSIYAAAQDSRIAGVAACASPANFNAIGNAEKPQLSINYFRKVGIIRDDNYPPNLEKWLSDFRMVNAVRVVSKISPRPLLIVHGKQDDVVPLADGQKLFVAAGEPRQLIILKNATHRLRLDNEAVAEVVKWLKTKS
jgi:uncharacterized protein